MRTADSDLSLSNSIYREIVNMVLNTVSSEVLF